MRAIDKGLGRPSEIAGFLELDDRVVESYLRTLSNSDDVMVGATQAAAQTRLLLTTKGKITLETLEVILPIEQIIVFDIDGLTRKAVRIPPGVARRPAQVERDRIDEVAPSPRSKPTFSEIDIELRRFMVESNQGNSFAKRDVLDLISVERTERWFRDDAVALLFKAVGGSETQVSFVLGETISEPHELAYSQSKHSNALGRTLAVKLETDSLGPLELLRSRTGGTNNTQDRLDRAVSSLVELSEQDASYRQTSLRDRTKLRQEIRRLQQEVSDLEADRDSTTRHMVEAYEHTGYMRKALESARNRLMIISPQIRSFVVNNPFLSALEKSLASGVQVYVGYGDAGDQPRSRQQDLNAVQRLEELSIKHTTFHLCYFDTLDANLLVCDGWCIRTSFRWFSYRGERYRPFKDERGTYISILDKVDAEFQLYLPRFTP
ncbi:MAG: hypothetical protein ACLQVD_09940 [Capsulimonadaceae bacterium]